VVNTGIVEQTIFNFDKFIIIKPDVIKSSKTLTQSSSSYQSGEGSSFCKKNVTK
jgi:hypothetical protein